MKHTKYIILLIIIFILQTASHASDIPATTKDGLAVILHDDGKWEYVLDEEGLHIRTQTLEELTRKFSLSSEDHTYVTMDGVDTTGKDLKYIVSKINLWKDYNNRGAGVTGSVSHGEKVKLLRREGDRVQIETKDKIKGWVTYYFIKEFK